MDTVEVVIHVMILFVVGECDWGAAELGIVYDWIAVVTDCKFG